MQQSVLPSGKGFRFRGSNLRHVPAIDEGADGRTGTEKEEKNGTGHQLSGPEQSRIQRTLLHLPVAVIP